MSDTQRCEPPEHLRAKGGQFWLFHPVSKTLLVWDWSGTYRCWLDGGSDRTPGDMQAVGWRYLAPVTPPSTVAALVEALEECADALRAEIISAGHGERYMRKALAPCERARATLALYRGDVA